MQQLDMYAEVMIRQQRDASQARLERRALMREALAGRRASFYRPALVSIGKRMVIWGTQLQRRYDDLYHAPEIDLVLVNKLADK